MNKLEGKSALVTGHGAARSGVARAIRVTNDTPARTNGGNDESHRQDSH